LLTQVGGANGLAIVVAGSIVISLALAPVFSLTTELIVGSAPPERAGAVSGISETAAELGGALGIAILGSIGVALYRSGLANELPAEVPTEAAAAAHDTLGAALNVAQQLPDGLGVVLLEVARSAFVQGMQVTSAISAVVAIGIAILALVMLRHVPPSSQPQEHLPAAEPKAAVEGPAATTGGDSDSIGVSSTV
jgi:DHA2 family multidrug resistance protein-like MFS transporter